MSSELAIKVEHLSKCYLIYGHPQDRLKQMLMRGRKKYYREFWALRDVSFEIRRGETVGIVGRNGGGKSTLLQLICGTTNPTGGIVQASGRIAALLELGSGFNPEFTGRENVYLNASVLGLGRAEIDARFGAIADFAELGDFIDQPVKTYSSGMTVRLAFSVAINVQPEVLIIDEALAVGDELFQRKCFSRIEEIRAAGATILFVSHSSSTVVELCDRAILLDAGEQLAQGDPKQVIDYYHKLLYAPEDGRARVREEIKGVYAAAAPGAAVDAGEDDSRVVRHVGDVARILEEVFDPHLMPTSTVEYESLGAYIESPMILTLAGERVNNLVRGRDYIYSYKVRFERSAGGIRFGMLIKTTSGVELGGGASAAPGAGGLPYVKAGQTYRVEFRFSCHLNPGVYFLNAGLVGNVNGSEVYLHRLVDVAMFRVQPESGSLSSGIVDFGCSSEVHLL